jgi:hypothetical protein
MVRIAEPIWAAWREQEDRATSPRFSCCCHRPATPGAAVNALRESVIEVQDAYESGAHRSGGAGVQLLGPGLCRPAARSAGWPEEPAGSASLLVEHVELAEWFDAPFIPFRQRLAPAAQPGPPAVLAQARVEQAPILYSPGVLTGAGYPNVDGGPQRDASVGRQN